MREGATVALVSDAGHAARLRSRATCSSARCVAAGLPVEVLPGPSAAITALVASGLPAAEWRFQGFLPRKRAELEAVLREPGGTLVAFESPRRVPATLAAVAELEPDRQVAVCRELTKAHEEVVRGSAAELAERYAGAPPTRRGGAGARPDRASGRAAPRAPRSTRCAAGGRRRQAAPRRPRWWPS